MNNEIWRDVVGYEGLYQVSNLGRVKSLGNNKSRKEKILKTGRVIQHNKLRDYIHHQLRLCKNGKVKSFFVSRLVWTSFNGDIPDGYDIDHINNNPEDNRLDNLQLLTRSKNCKKKFIDNPDLASLTGSYNNIEKINPKKKIKCLESGIIYESTREASRQLNIHQGNIVSVLKGRYKTTGGYHFEYVIP